MVCRVSEPLNARSRRHARRPVVIAAVALLLAASGGVVIWWNSFDDATCAAGADLACGEDFGCCEGDTGPRTPEDPETVQFPDATDLTAGAAAFTSTDGYLAAAPNVWVPDPEPEGWTPVPDSELVDAQLGFEADGAQVVCYASGQRTVAIADFLADDDVYSAIAIAERARNDEASVYERTTEPDYGHYRIDGNAVLAAEAEYTWTTAVDPDTGEITEGEWTERWGFVAVYRGSAGEAICSYGGPESAEALEEVQDHLLGMRLAE
jgi:hypothetical protein